MTLSGKRATKQSTKNEAQSFKSYTVLFVKHRAHTHIHIDELEIYHLLFVKQRKGPRLREIKCLVVLYK